MGTLSATDLDTLHRGDIGSPADDGVCALLSATLARAVCCWSFLVTVTLVEGASAHRLLAARFGSRGRAVRCASMAVGCSGESISAVDPPTPPPEMAQDFLQRGMYLVGGGGLLRGLAQRIEKETDVPVRMSPMPLEAVVLGAGHCVENYQVLRSMFMGARR